MANNTRKTLGERLGNIANTHRVLKNYKKKYMGHTKTYGFTTVQEFKNYERSLQEKNTNITNTGSNSNTSIRSNTSKASTCIITPGGQKMKKINGKWVKCSMGGKRKTRRSKKSRRVTRKRR